MEKVLNLIFVPMLIFSVSVICLFGLSHINHKLEYKEDSLQFVEYVGNRPDYVTEEYIKQEVDSLFCNVNYIFGYKDLPSGKGGVSYIILKLVCIDTDLSLEDFAFCLTHELVHLTHFTINERYTNFKTFQILYESGNEYFKNVALAYADKDVKGLVPYEYSCGGYIEEYLKEG